MDKIGGRNMEELGLPGRMASKLGFRTTGV
jgi:hypothetical protein